MIWRFLEWFTGFPERVLELVMDPPTGSPSTRLVCFFLGHQWFTLFGSISKAIALASCHLRAGQDDFCPRCGALWEDALPEHRAMFWAGIKPPGPGGGS